MARSDDRAASPRDYDLVLSPRADSELMQWTSERNLYLVEWYRPRFADGSLEEATKKIQRAIGPVSDADTPADLLLTLFAPEDEVAFSLFAAGSPASVAQVCGRAELPYQRITEVLETTARRGVGGWGFLEERGT